MANTAFGHNVAATGDDAGTAPAAAGQAGRSPAHAHMIGLAALGIFATVAGLILSGMAVDEARPSTLLTDTPNPWPAIMAGPVFLFGVLSIVASILLGGIRQLVLGGQRP